MYYQVKRLNNDSWTHILPKLLYEISLESVSAVRAALTEKVCQEYGLQVGDAITWKVEDIPLTGIIVHLTKLGAFIDEGQPGLAWVKYHRLIKILPNGDATSLDQQVACSPTHHVTWQLESIEARHNLSASSSAPEKQDETPLLEDDSNIEPTGEITDIQQDSSLPSPTLENVTEQEQWQFTDPLDIPVKAWDRSDIRITAF